MSPEQIYQLAKQYGTPTSTGAAALSTGGLGFGSDASDGSDKFADSLQYQPDSTPVTSVESIDRSLIPPALFAKATETPSAFDKVEQAIRRGSEDIAKSGENLNDAARELAIGVGMQWSDVADNAGSSVRSAADKTEKSLRSAADETTNAATDWRSQMQYDLPARQQVQTLKDEISAAPSRVQDSVGEMSVATKAGAQAAKRDIASAADDHIVTPIMKSAADLESRVPGPSSVAQTISETASKAADEAYQHGQAAIDTVTSAYGDGRKTVNSAVADASAAAASAASSMPLPTEARRAFGNYQRATVEEAEESTVNTAQPRAPLETTAPLPLGRGMPIPSATPVPDDTQSPADPPVQSAFDSWGSANTNYSEKDLTSSAHRVGPSLASRFGGRLKAFGIDLDQFGRQTSTVAHNGYDATTTALHNGYDKTASTLRSGYHGAADTASSWRTRLGQTASNFGTGIQAFFRPATNPIRPMTISDPVLTHTTLDPAPSLVPIQPVSTTPATPGRAPSSTVLAVSIPANSNLLNGGWLKSLLPSFRRSSAAARSETRPTATVAETAPTSSAALSNWIPQATPSATPSARSWFSSWRRPLHSVQSGGSGPASTANPPRDSAMSNTFDTIKALDDKDINRALDMLSTVGMFGRLLESFA